MQQLEGKIDKVVIAVTSLTDKVDTLTTKVNTLSTKVDVGFSTAGKETQFLTEMTKDGFTAMTSDFAGLEANISAELEKYMGTNREELESHATRIKDLETEVWPDGKPEPAH